MTVSLLFQKKAITKINKNYQERTQGSALHHLIPKVQKIYNKIKQLII